MSKYEEGTATEIYNQMVAASIIEKLEAIEEKKQAEKMAKAKDYNCYVVTYYADANEQNVRSFCGDDLQLEHFLECITSQRSGPGTHTVIRGNQKLHSFKYGVALWVDIK